MPGRFPEVFAVPRTDPLSWSKEDTMSRVRHKLRLFVTVWLAFQAASFSALVPASCCAEHQVAAKTSCHEPPPDTHCPMQSAEGVRCPMHQGHHDQSAPAQPPACSLRGSCGGPMAALVTLISTSGILADAVSVSPAIEAARVPAAAAERLVSKLVPPEAPPPRV